MVVCEVRGEVGKWGEGVKGMGEGIERRRKVMGGEGRGGGEVVRRGMKE